MGRRDPRRSGNEDFMKEISIHGRGGQGSLVLAQFMAIAALEDGKYGYAFPFLGAGGERRGKPIIAFCRLGEEPILKRCRVSEPDYVIVQDATIFNEVDVLKGLKPGGSLLVNSKKKDFLPSNANGVKVFGFSAEDLARSILGRPIMNTALLGAFAALTDELSLDAVLKAVRMKFPGELGEKNAIVVKKSYERVMEENA